MRSLASKRTAISGFWITLGCLLAAMIGFYLLSAHNAGAAPQPSAGERLITIHEDGEERVIFTRATTLGKAFEGANITLDPKDLVEPGLDHELVAPNYEVNIYRARPVTIVDGSVRQKVLSPYHTAMQIAKQAGIELYPEDGANVDVHAGTSIGQDVGLEMTVDRATPFTFVLYGKTMTARTQATTVEEMLKEKDITLGANDRVSVAGSTAIAPELTVRVWREGKQTVTVDEEVGFETETVKDADRPTSYREIKTPGAKGNRSVTYEITIQDGKEVARTEIASIVSKEPVKQVEVVGSKLPTPTNPTEAQALGHQMMLDYGFGEDQWPCLYNLWMHESGWRTTAANPSGAYGIPQALPGSKMGEGWQTSAATQIQWGLGYIKGRYSTPCGAMSAWQSKGWY
jgi:resuscitation-promoting factor RpfB